MTNEKEKKLFASDSRCTVYRTFRKLDKCLCFFSSQTAKRRVRTNCTARTLLLLSLHRQNLCQKSIKRVFPAIDIQKSGTRREDLLLTKDEQEIVYNMRRALNSLKAEDAVEQILNMFSRTKNNAEFIQTAKKQKFL